MRAAVVETWGRNPVYTEVSDPQPGDGATIATVEASALTNLVRGIASGNHYSSREFDLPLIPGVDGVVRLQDGRRVYSGATAPAGMMAERTLVGSHGLVEVPDGVDSVTAAAIGNPGMSAWMSLEYGAAIRPGQNVLVLGATGVTGSVAVQLAKRVFGADRVVVAGRDTGRLEWLQTAGADEAIAMTTDDLGERVTELHAQRPFDAVLDYLWGEPAQTTLTALAASHPSTHFHATRFVQIGSIAGTHIDVPAAVLRSTGITLSGVGIGSVPPDVMGKARSEALPRLFEMLAAGELDLRTQARPLADVEAVWAGAEPSGTRVVLVP